MRFQYISALFLSLCLVPSSMAHIAKAPPNSLQSRDPDRPKKFAPECKSSAYHFDTSKCVLSSECPRKSDNVFVKSELNINDCLRRWVISGTEKKDREKLSIFGWKNYGEKNKDFELIDKW